MGKSKLRMIAVGVAGVAAVAGALAFSNFRADMRRHEQRLANRSQTISTQFGQLEYAVRGEGAPLLMIHGTGGGFDQGLTFSENLIGNGVRVIAPSRFGYLRSSWPSDPSSERQADAFVELLDHLRLEKVAVAGGSAGALPAVQFALRHPERTSGVILFVPAVNVEGHDPNEMGALRSWMVKRLVTSDFLFWAAKEALAQQMIGFLLATDPELVAQAPIAERQRAHAILDQIQPISRRWRGMLNDAKLAGHPASINLGQLRVPLLVLSANDDRFGTAATARAIARQVPGSKLVVYATGGHIFVGHQRDFSAETAKFIRAHQT